MAESWMEQTMPQVKSTLATQAFNSQFSALTTNADRVQFCLAQKEVQDLVGLFESKICSFTGKQTGYKCPKFSAVCREKGIDHFRVNNFKSAIQFYSAALCYAPQIGVDNTGELALAFGNRSAAYFQLGQHDNALKDINDALAFGYGQFESVTKLQLRKCDSLIRLGRASEAEEFLNFMQKPTDDEKDTKHWNKLFGLTKSGGDKKKSNLFPKVCNISVIEKLTNKGQFKSNKKIPSFSTKVAVQYDELKGRHLVAQEDIEFGDILAVFQPYVTLLDSKVEIIKYCHHCCRDHIESTPIRPVPCTSCSSVVYCSEECRTESANSYHRYECGQTDLLVQLPKLLRMALRMLYRAGMDQIRSVVDSVTKEASHLSDQPEDHYSHVYQLVHSDGPLNDLNISYDEMFKSSILACLLLQLVKNSNFPMDLQEDKMFIGGILLRHLLQSRFNTFGYSPFNKKASSPSAVLLDLYPMYASTLNHSCICGANAQLESPSNDESVCLLQATRSISAGTEISIPYLENGDLFNPFAINPGLFKTRYLIECFCARCIYYARNTPFELHDYLDLSCSDCGHLMEHSSEYKSESEVFCCTNCPLTMNYAEMTRRYHLVGQLQCLYEQLFRSGGNQVLKLKETVEQFEALLHRDSGILSVFYSSLGGYYLLCGRMDKAWACLEQFLSIYGRTFGEESVALLEAFNYVQKHVLNPMTNMMKVFEQQDSELYQRYLARMEQCKQLKLKYYPDY